MSTKLVVHSTFTAALFGLAFIAATPARADVEVGTLMCRSLQPTSYVVVSSQPFGCIFTPSYGGPPQRYEATINRIGAQVGINRDVALAWAVFAPTPHVGLGALAGGYGGVSAGAAIGVGAAANGLVGGANSFALQPLSVEGQTGLNVVATTAVTADSAHPTLRRSHVRHAEPKALAAG